MKQDKDNNLAQQNLLRETLLNQMKMNDLNKKNFGKMTLVEKRLNRNDLQSYKHKERNTVNAMVPGINNFNSVGSKPL